MSAGTIVGILFLYSMILMSYAVWRDRLHLDGKISRLDLLMLFPFIPLVLIYLKGKKYFVKFGNWLVEPLEKNK